MSQNENQAATLAPAPNLPPLQPEPSWHNFEEGASGSDIPLGFYLHLLRRYRWRLLTFVFLVTSAATLISITLPKRYAATATLRIEPSSMRTLGETSQTGFQFSITRLISTEASELTSPAVILPTINNLNLYRLPEFASAQLPPNAQAPNQTQMNAVISKVAAGISVEQPINTNLLRVSFRSLNPALSAQVANSLLQSLIDHDYHTRLRALMSSSQSMRAQLVSLRAKMERSQADLVNYESTHDVLDPSSKTNIMNARLEQVNTNLGIAQTKRMELQAAYNIVQSGNFDALLASGQGENLLPLQSHLQRDQQTLDRMAQVYGPNYPVFRQQQALVRNDRALLHTQELHVARQIRSRYKMARINEGLLQTELNLQKQRMDAFNLKAIRYYALKAAAYSYQKLYYELQQRIQDATIAANLHSESLRIISPARPNPIPVYPRPLLTAVLSLLLSSLFAVGVVIAVGLMDSSISTPDQVEHWFGMQVLSTIPMISVRDAGKLLQALGTDLSETAPNKPPSTPRHAGYISQSSYRESILSLHNAILMLRGQDLQTLAITSALPSEGKSMTSSHLALAFAGMGRRILLVDADMRKPSVHRNFVLANRRGLSTVLRGKCGIEQAFQTHPRLPNLTIMSAGSIPPNPAELLHLGMTDLLDQLRSRFDCILLDCPPVLGFADVLSIANIVEGCLVTVMAGRTERHMVASALRQLRTARAQLLGIVLNGISRDLGHYYSYYSQYYRYGENAPAETETSG